MPDFPSGGYTLPHLHVITPQSMDGLGVVAYAQTASIGWTGSLTWPTANTAVYWPFVVERPMTIYQLGVLNGSVVAGNVDAAIYDINWNRLVSIGSTAHAGVTTIQAFDIADTVLTPGYYFGGFNASSTTATFGGMALTSPTSVCTRGTGVQIQAVGAVTLPNPATPANPSVNVLVPTMILFSRNVF